MLEETVSDILLLYDCCHSAATTIFPFLGGYRGLKEVISACGPETMAAPPLEYSFSRALTQIFSTASQGQPFSVGELHVRVLSRLMSWTPCLVLDQDRKSNKDLTGSLMYQRQSRRIPIHNILCAVEPHRRIIIAPLERPTFISEIPKSPDDARDPLAVLAEGSRRQEDPATERNVSTEESLNPSFHPKQQHSNRKEMQYPQVLLAVGLGSDTFDEAAWLEWLQVAPPQCTEVKIEGIYDSFPKLLLLRMPVATWNLLPENSAYTFVGFVSSENKVGNLAQLDIPITNSETTIENLHSDHPQRGYEDRESGNARSWDLTRQPGWQSDENRSATKSKTAMASTIYSHCILNPILYEIRVLELQPDLCDSSPISVRLSKAFVSDPPKYHALSYLWGDSSEKVPIFVDGKRFNIGKNLFAALKCLRLRDSSLLLWADAVCIDQENVSERNFQVRLMKQIYSSAEQVIIWLGENEDDSDLAMDLITTWAPPDAEEMSMPELLKTVISKPNALDLRSWHAARRLFAREYWFRAWVLQEIAFSNRAMVRCGTKQVAWRDFYVVQWKWEQLKSEPENFHLLTPEQLKMVSLTFFSAVSSITLQHLAQQDPNLPRSLFRLLRNTSASHATDPRDKIYALLGFEEVSVLDLEPDYTKPVERVYAEFVQAYLEAECKLDILFQTGIGYKIAEPLVDLPSWVPDFRRSVYSVHSNHFHAADGTLALATISIDLRKLTARGIIYDVITNVDSGRGEEQKRIKSRWLDLALGHQIKHPTGIPQLQAYFRTVVADDSGFGYGKPGFRNEESRRLFFNLAAGMMFLLGEMALKKDPSAIQALREPKVEDILGEADYILHFFIWHQQIPALMSREALLAPFLGDRESGQDSQIRWPEEDDDKTRGSTGSHIFLEKETFACTSQCFFLTAKGYMGIGCRGIRKDDVVCVLLGCNMPLIIRKMADHYLLVGNAYIYGLMNGEALQDIQESKANVEDIIFQ